jgi:hypothetical protein
VDVILEKIARIAKIARIDDCTPNNDRCKNDCHCQNCRDKPAIINRGNPGNHGNFLGTDIALSLWMTPSLSA